MTTPSLSNYVNFSFNILAVQNKHNAPKQIMLRGKTYIRGAHSSSILFSADVLIEQSVLCAVPYEPACADKRHPYLHIPLRILFVDRC